MAKKKLFISQPMSDKSNGEIKRVRTELIATCATKHPDDEIEVIDSFFEDAPHDARPLWYLGKSIQLLSEADMVAFAEGWHSYRGCRIEHACAESYGIEIVTD